MKYRIMNPALPTGWKFVGGMISIEFWETEYGFVDFKDKRVMDIGADWGRTADYFLQKGAKEVIAVEGKPAFYRMLEENAVLLPEITPVFLSIRSSEDFTQLITQWRPDLMQADCEGCEEFLFQVSDAVFSLVSEYLVETHSPYLYRILKKKLGRNEYTIVEDRAESPKLRVIYAVAQDRAQDRYVY